MKEMSERRAHLLMQRGSETLRRSTGSLFACTVKHPMREARSCAAVMAMGSWKQPDERCYIHRTALGAEFGDQDGPGGENRSKILPEFSRELSDEPIRVKLSNQSCALEALERVGARVSENSTRSAG